MFDELLAANHRYVAGFDLAGLDAHPARRFALVTCMDTRVDPLPVLGLRAGDANVIRNAGGRVTSDALRSLALARASLGVSHVAVMHHTGCALAGRTDGQVQAEMGAAAETWEWLAMPDPDAALAADVAAVQACPLLAGVAVEGWRYEVATGAVQRIVARPRRGQPG